MVWGQTQIKASKNHNNVVGEEWLALIRTIVLSLGGKLTYLFICLYARASLSYAVFKPKPSTHRMHDPGSFVPHIRPNVLTDNQMS
jgi:hypothetical protein